MLRGPRSMGREAVIGLSGEQPGRAYSAVGLYLALVVVGAGLAWGLGMAVYQVQSSRVATLVSVAAAMFGTIASAILVPHLLRLAGSKAPLPEAAPAANDGISGIRGRVFCAVRFAAIEDGLVTASTTLRAHISSSAALGAGLDVACFLALPLALLLLPLGFLLSRPGASVVAKHVRAGLGGGDPGAEATGTVLYTVLLACASSLSWGLGLRTGEVAPAETAVLVSTVSAVVCTIGAAPLVAFIVRPAAWLVGKAARVPLPDWLPVEDALMAATGVVILYVLLPPSHAITPAAGVVGFAMGPHLASRIPFLATISRLRSPVLVVVAAALTLGAAVAFDRASDLVRVAVLGRAPYGGIIVTGLRRPFDRDHDGYARILAGGDCDDGNPNVHPGAVEIPDNGIDENCSGADAHGYRPPVQEAKRDLSAPPMRDNVILVHVEALRPDHVGFIGYGRKTTPRIDRFREGATWFKNAYSPAPTTRFALSMLFTGWEIERIPQARGHAVDYTLLPEALTLAEQLEPLGYDRVGYTLSYVIQHIHGLGQGFRIWETPWPLHEWERSYQDSAQETTDAALKYLATMPADGSKPYFLFLHYECTHDPYIKHTEKPGWDYGDDLVDKYDSALSYQDDQLGRLFDALDARADKERTAVILYSDHGELFGEHGYHRHGFTLYQPDVKIVMLARIPGTHVATIETPVLLSDLAPTIAELTGLPPDKQTQTWDLMPYLRGAPLPPRQLFLYADQWRTGVHYVSRGVLDADGRTMLIRNVSAGTRELFDVINDPNEQTNLAEAMPETRDRLNEAIDGWESFENQGNKSFEAQNKEVNDKQRKLPLPVFP